jgi:hypothetical protein
MAKWHYAFMFPDSAGRLLPANAIQIFADAGFEFDRKIFPAVAADAAGHLEPGDSLELSGNTIKELVNRLNNDEQFLVECRNRDLFFSIFFATKNSNPYLVVGWSQRIFAELNDDLQQRYWQLLKRVARGCGATYVIVVDDPPDYFEDRFLEIDGRRFLENQTLSGRKYDIRSVWIDVDSLEPRPEGINGQPLKIGIDGYSEYVV